MKVGQQSALNDIEDLNERISDVKEEMDQEMSGFQDSLDSLQEVMSNSGNFSESGNYDPVIMIDGIEDSSLSFVIQKGKYNKIGNICFYYVDLMMGSVETPSVVSGQISVSLPFTSTEGYTVPTFRATTAIDVGDGNFLSACPVAQTNLLKFQGADSSSDIFSDTVSLEIATNRRINVSGFFFV